MKSHMMNSWTYLLLTLSLFIFSGERAQAQRVLEVENNIKVDIQNYLERVLPETRYTINVEVTPLRRRASQNSRYQESALPYMDLEEEYVTDEWDNPEVSLYSLYSRISDVKITLSVDSGVVIDNRQQFISRMLAEANLIEGRDQVYIDTLEPAVVDTGFSWKKYKEELLVGMLLIGLLILGMFVSNVGVALAKSNKKGSSSITEAHPASVPVTVARSPEVGRVSSESVSSLKGDLFLQDPTKITETVGKKINALVESGTFPCLSDMVCLEYLAKKDISAFSYLIYEFPTEVQETIYQYGRDYSWFKGFSAIGFPTKEVLITLDRMLRERDYHFSKEFEDVLIYLWRLDLHVEEVLRPLDKKVSLKFLSLLPKELSIPVARKLYPGSWGLMFESSEFSEEDIKIDSLQLQKIKTKCLEKKELFAFKALQEFKDRKDLLNYLDHVGPKEEREIYSVMGEQGDIADVRPPFFSLFDLEEAQLKEVVKKFNLNEWSLALLEVEHGEREKVVDLLDDKEKYLFSEYLRDFGRSMGADTLKQQRKIRKTIALFIRENYQNENTDSSLGEVASKSKEDKEDLDVVA